MVFAVAEFRFATMIDDESPVLFAAHKAKT